MPQPSEFKIDEKIANSITSDIEIHWVGFIQKKGRYPEYLHMHPLDANKLRMAVNFLCTYNFPEDQQKYRGRPILRSLDVAEGQWFFS